VPAIEREILDVIRRVFRTDLAYDGVVGPQCDLQRDLHVDSLNAVILAVALEDYFRVRLAAEDTADVTTVADLVARVAQRVRDTRGGAVDTTA
jgi:acyl carrier protein